MPNTIIAIMPPKSTIHLKTNCCFSNALRTSMPFSCAMLTQSTMIKEMNATVKSFCVMPNSYRLPSKKIHQLWTETEFFSIHTPCATDCALKNIQVTHIRKSVLREAKSL